MAITIKHSTNAALQYNEAGLSDYLISNGAFNKKFLTKSPSLRTVNRSELASLYFLIDDTDFSGSIVYEMRDASGTVIASKLVSLSDLVSVHNAALFNWTNEVGFESYDIAEICAKIIEAENLVTNPDFAEGSGDLFTDWTESLLTDSVEAAKNKNELLYSKDFSNAVWNKLNSTIEGTSVFNPKEGNVGYKLVANDTSNIHAILQNITSVSKTWTYYVDAKAAEYDRLVLFVQNTNFVGFNLTNGTVESSLGTGITSANIEHLGDGVYRCSITSTSTDTSTSASIGVFNAAYLNGNSNPVFTGDGTSGIYIFNAQLTPDVDYATEYIPTTNAAVTVNDGIGASRAVRLNGDGAYVSKEVTQNLVLYANDFSNAVWNKNNLTQSSGDMTTTATADAVFIAQNSAGGFVNGNTYTLWAELKPGTATFVQLLCSTGQAVGNAYANFDLTNGTYSLGAGVSANITVLESGWLRCELTYVSNVTGSNDPIFFFVDSLASSRGSNFSGAIGRTMSIRRVQQNPGTCATTFINTTNTQITKDEINLTPGKKYKVSFYAKKYIGTPSFAVVEGCGNEIEPFEITETDWTLHSFEYTPTAYDIKFELLSAGSIGIDDVAIWEADALPVTETKCIKIDNNCYKNTNEVHWINKLGGEDSFTFTGLPISEKSIDRDNAIENPMNGNFVAPKPIFQNRKVSSSESLTLYTRCENEQMARWLRSELFDNVATYLKIGDEFYPIIPKASKVEVYNENGFNYNVVLNFNFAYDVNIQTV